MEEKQTRFVEFSESESESERSVPESTKKSTKYAVNVFKGEES